MTVTGLRSVDSGLVYPIPLRSALYSVGRAPECDLAIEHETVSRRHCVIERRHDDSVIIVETGSANGTAVDGKPVTTCSVLTPGSLLELGRVRLKVQGAIGGGIAEPPPIEPSRIEPPPRLIDTVDGLRRYIIGDLRDDLEALEDLGETEGDFEHRIANAIRGRIRISPESFGVSIRRHLPQVNRFPDITIQHVHGRTAIEIKKNGQLDGLLADARELRRFLRGTRMRVIFGVLIYISRMDIPKELSRAMAHDDLQIIRVRPSKRR